MRRLGKYVAAVLVAGCVAVVLLSVDNGLVAKQVTNVFSNISTGLPGSSFSTAGDGLAIDNSLRDQAAAQPAKAAEMQSSVGTGSGGSASLALGNPPGQVERTVEASYVVPHNKFETSFKDLIARAVGEGGFVVSTSTQPDSAGHMVSGTVVMKVPAAKLSDFLDGLPTGTFKASAINFGTIDHTAQYIDTKARLNQAQKVLDALERALAATSNPDTIANLTQQIANAQADLEKQQAAFAVVQQSVDLSTVTTHLKESGATIAPEKPGDPIFVSSAHSGWNNDIAIFSAIVYGLLTALPVLILLVLIAWQRRRLFRLGKALLT